MLSELDLMNIKVLHNARRGKSKDKFETVTLELEPEHMKALRQMAHESKTSISVVAEWLIIRQLDLWSPTESQEG